MRPGDYHEGVEPEENRRTVNARSLRRTLLRDVTDAALSHAQEAEPPMDGLGFEEIALQGIEVVNDLQSGLTEDGCGSQNWNFWKHEEDPLRRIKSDDMPYMYRDYLESAASDYLRLPYRAPILERVLVDVMIALEVYAY